MDKSTKTQMIKQGAQRYGRQAGLNLVESSIIFSVFAFIIGALIFGMGNAFLQVKIENSLREVATLRDQTRQYAQGFFSVGSASPGTNITTELINNDVVPSFMRRGTLVVHSWPDVQGADSGTITVTGLLDRFAIRLNNLPQGACSELSARFADTGSEDALLQMDIGDTAGSASTLAFTSFPVRPVTSLADACARTTDPDTNFINLTYGLRAL